jgi:hypothetical protein
MRISLDFYESGRITVAVMGTWENLAGVAAILNRAWTGVPGGAAPLGWRMRRIKESSSDNDIFRDSLKVLRPTLASGATAIGSVLHLLK